MRLTYGLRLLCLTLCMSLLAGCMGGPIAQQIVTSMISNKVDQVTSDAYDSYLLQQANEKKSITLKDTEPDRYWAAFVTSGFNTIPANPEQEALDRQAERAKEEADLANAPEASKLVSVEVWNVLIGDEKLRVLNKAKDLGATDLPAPQEWIKWQVATGALVSDPTKMLTFLVPPDLGKISSGKHTYVEIQESGGLHIARYVTQ